MEKVKVELEAAKEMREVAVALENLVLAVKDALKDGFQAGQDIPAVLMVAFKDLTVAIDGAEKIGGEFKEDLACALNALAPMPGKIAAAFIKKA